MRLEGGGRVPTARGEKRLGQCPACWCTDRERDWTARGLELYRCLACGLVYADPQPRDRIREKYTKDYDLAVHFGQHQARKRVLFERRLDRIGSPVLGRRLFDAGCGDGLFLELATRRGWEVCGIELNPPAAAEARLRGVQVFEGALEEAPDLPWGSFEVVTCWDSIEHTPEPRLFAQALARLLAPKGKLVLTTMNRRSLAARAFGSRWSLVGEDHFTYWDGRSLTALCRNAGLVVSDTRFFGLGRDFVRWMDRLAGCRHASPSRTPKRRDESWDSVRAVTHAEAVLNRILNSTHLGVGIEVVAESAARGARGDER
jgi:SAM-dependent methyltransferase